ncbi:hypothetical protein HPB51_024231 [Rhipicephalus microplus]|uniref:Uncharacterized protein n=1 Tax=Rhipicephalus microplus TaxID=6941 RepID=A0A9J6DXI8_RHIMP|nr:hypothetical protein HPB51_024231 [Rhipicephalus microplus]
MRSAAQRSQPLGNATVACRLPRTGCFKRLDDCATLKSRCLRKVVLLIMTARKPPDDFACPPELNPFISFPSDLVEDLIETVIQMSPRARDKITPDVRADDLSLLVRSGRVRCFSLWDVEMHSRDFSAALRQLGDTGAAAALRELEIDGVYVRGRRPESILRSLDNVGRLLRAAPKLRALRLGLSGRSLLDLAALENLEELSVTYDCHRELDDIIGQAEKTGDPLWPRLRHFYLTRRLHIFIVQQCTKEISHQHYLRGQDPDSIYQLHEQQFLQEGGLVCRYRLQKTAFGSFVYGSDQQKRPPQRDLDICGPSPLCVQIATVACPNLVDVDVYVDCHESVLALAEFSHLRYLKLMWVSSKLAGCFETSTLSLLHEVGCQLVELCLHSFVKVDLNAVAFLCPSLEAFGLIQCRTVANHVPVSQPFAALTKVRVIPPPDYPAIQAEDDLCCVLGSCSALKSFVVDLVADDFELLVDRLLQSTNSGFRSVELAGLYFQQPTTTPAVRDGVLRLLLACEALR